MKLLVLLLGTCLTAQAAITSSKHGKSFLLQADKTEGRWEPPWESTKHHASTRLQCGITETVGAHTDKYEDCPASCPYFAQNRKDTEHCTFLCVPGDECGRWNPNKPIPDSIKNTKTCRGPKVSFCTQPKLDGTDTCDVCMSGYRVFEGHCYFKYWTPLIIVSIILVIIFTVVIVWVVDLCCRASVNDESVHSAELWRSRSKIIERIDGDGIPDKTFPLTTNLCVTEVAGPGMLLHFRFQAFFIVWPFCCAMVWVALACFHNELFILGTRKFGTPRHNCILVAWGYETQQRLMWTKVVFLAIVYVGSFISFLLFSVSQLRTNQRLDAKDKTMKDFAVELKGLPLVSADHATFEKDIKHAVEAATKKNVVGVSVAWNYSEQQDDIDAICTKDLVKLEIEWELMQESEELKPHLQNKRVSKKPTADEIEKELQAEKEKMGEPENMGAVRKWMYSMEKKVLGPDEETPSSKEDVKALLGSFKSSDTAFVVFDTEDIKDEVLKSDIKIELKGAGYGDGTFLTVNEVCNEPANLNWHNFGDDSGSAVLLGFLKGFFKVYVPALLVWFFGFYVPYAWSLYNFNYDNGAELPGYYSIIFTIIVCGGNATMYVVCDICCDIIGFRYKDTKQVTYMLMYLCACMINVFLDMVVTYFTAYKVMVGLDFRTYHGERLGDIDVFTEQFETYAMQRSLGENTYRYAWPSTFFLCFVLEPFVTIIVPYLIGRVIIRTHKEIRGSCAEAYLMAFEFDLGRYADILLNVFLGCLIFYFPGGYIWGLFFAMCFSHCFIYCFDHWRVLQVIPYIKIVSTNVDWWAQVMMCFCCAVILSCLVFKANCESYSGYCLQEFSLIALTSAAGAFHFIVHFLLLCYLVPKLGLDPVDLKDYRGDATFQQVAALEPRTWFSVNPVHCLRSKYILEKKLFSVQCAWGKEHLLQLGDKHECHYSRGPPEAEEFDVRMTVSRTLRKMTHHGEDSESPSSSPAKSETA